MTDEQATKCLGLLLAIAFDSGLSRDEIQRVIKGFLAREIAPSEVAAVPWDGMDFSVYLN
jgi:hypothetical protein